MVEAANGTLFQSKYIVNAAGLAAAEIAGLAGAGTFSIHPRSGEYIILNRGSGELVNHVLFQMPTKLGKGILVTPTVYGNLLIGPDAIDEQKNNRDTHAERLYHIYKQALHTAPGINLKLFLRSFAGVRPVSSTDDFIIEQSAPGFINVAGIQSPGLTASPAVADMVCNLLGEAGLLLTPDLGFQPNRPPTYQPHEPLPPNELQPLLSLPEGSENRMVCRCEQVAETTIRNTAARSIPLNTVDAVKRRTRAGMGYCQGAFCRPRTAALLSHLQKREISPKTDVEISNLQRINRDEMLEYIEQVKE